MGKDLSGSFWLPGAGSPVSGHLNFNETSITITLLGDIYGGINSLGQGVSRQKLKAVYGNVEGLGKVTLFNSCIVGNEMNSVKGGAPIVNMTIRSSTILVGANIDRKETVEFNKVAFSIEGLNEWADGVSGIEETTTRKEPLKIGFSYEFPPTQEFELGSDDKVLNTQTSVKKEFGIREAKLIQKVRLGLRRKNKGTLYGGLDDAMVDIHGLRDLLSLFIGRRVAIGDIRLENYDASTDKYKVGCQYFMADPMVKPTKIYKTDIFILFSDIKEGFEEILKEWFKFREHNEHILNELFNTYLGGSIFSTFFSCSKIVEALHRNINDGKPFTSKQIKEINKEIKSLVSRYDEKIQGRYLEEIGGVNRYTLQERLESLFDEFLSDDIKASIGTDPKFVKRVKDVRNDLAHLNKGVSKLDIRELYDLSNKLNILIHIIIFKLIGLTDELLLRKLDPYGDIPLALRPTVEI